MTALVQSGLFFSQLDRQQTSVDQRKSCRSPRIIAPPGQKEFDRRANRRAYDRAPATAMETAFRHSGWTMERARVREALKASHVSADRLDRFEQCGGDCVVEYSPSTKRHRLRANYCGDRFCIPCARARSKRLERAIVSKLAGLIPLFMTLTLQANDNLLVDCLNHLQESFRRLRQQRLWTDNVKGGVAVVEIKRGAGSGKWHVHLHVLAESRSIDARLLSDAWRLASRGSFIVDVSRVRRFDQGIGYVAKYAGKGWTAEVVRDRDSLIECVCALRGRRLLIVFGGWSKLESYADVPDPGDWRRIARLNRVCDEFTRGEAWAVGVMRALHSDHLELALAPPAPE